MDTNSSPIPTNGSGSAGLWPAVLAWLFLYVTLGVLIRWTFQGLRLETFLEGYIIGICGLMVIEAGLWGRNWITGWLLGICLSVVGLVAYAVASGDYAEISSTLAAIWLLPLISLSGCLPFIAARNLWGWSFTRHDQVEIQRSRASVEDIFLISIVTASALTLFHFPQQYWGRYPGWLAVAVMSYASLASLVIALPLTWVTFRLRCWQSRLGAWLFAGALVLLVCLVIEWLLGAPFGQSLEFLLKLVSSAQVTLMFGLGTWLLSGLRLTRFSMQPAAETLRIDSSILLHPLDTHHVLDGDTVPKTSKARTAMSGDRRFMRHVTMGVSCIALCVMASEITLRFVRQNNWQRIGQLQTNSSSHLTDVWAPGGVIREITVSAEFDDRELEQLVSQFPRLQRLNLAGSKVTGAALPQLQQLRFLTHLDLTDIELNDGQLREYSPAQPLRRLALAGTKVSFHAAMEWAGLEKVEFLDVARLGITDAQLRAVSTPRTLRGLRLASNPITDAGLQALSRFKYLESVDLSDTTIDGSGLKELESASLRNWILDGTAIADSHLIALFSPGRRWPSPNQLSIQRTGITPVALKVLASKNIDLTLGEGLISDKDLAQLPSAWFSRLSLHGPNFTGACLAAGNISTQYLDLSHSQVTDQEIQALRTVCTPLVLNLSYTRVTPHCLQFQLAHQVIFHGNKVTANELLQATRSNNQIFIRSRDFTAAENSLMQQFINFLCVDKLSEY